MQARSLVCKSSCSQSIEAGYATQFTLKGSIIGFELLISDCSSTL